MAGDDAVEVQAALLDGFAALLDRRRWLTTGDLMGAARLGAAARPAAVACLRGMAARGLAEVAPAGDEARLTPAGLALL